MGWVSGTVVYLLVWWVVLFAVLPVGMQPNPEGDSETGWRGVPQRPMLLRKALITSLAAAVIWLGIYALIESDWLSFRSGWLALPEK